MVHKKIVDVHPPLTNPALAFIDLTNCRYTNGNVIVIHRNTDSFGEWLNMTSKYPITVNGILIPSAEHLYQVCRFPHRIDVQQGIIDQPNPLLTKRWASQFRDEGLPEWYQVKALYMNYVVHAKLACHYDEIGKVLEESGDRTIVETSPDGNWWGCVREIRGDETSALIGANVFGQLLMHLRDEYRTKTKENLLVVEPLDMPDFLLLGKPIERVIGGS